MKRYVHIICRNCGHEYDAEIRAFQWLTRKCPCCAVPLWKERFFNASAEETGAEKRVFRPAQMFSGAVSRFRARFAFHPFRMFHAPRIALFDRLLDDRTVHFLKIAIRTLSALSLLMVVLMAAWLVLAYREMFSPERFAYQSALFLRSLDAFSSLLANRAGEFVLEQFTRISLFLRSLSLRLRDTEPFRDWLDAFWERWRDVFASEVADYCKRFSARIPMELHRIAALFSALPQETPRFLRQFPRLLNPRA